MHLIVFLVRMVLLVDFEVAFKAVFEAVFEVVFVIGILLTIFCVFTFTDKFVNHNQLCLVLELSGRRWLCSSK